MGNNLCIDIHKFTNTYREQIEPVGSHSIGAEVDLRKHTRDEESAFSVSLNTPGNLHKVRRTYPLWISD